MEDPSVNVTRAWLEELKVFSPEEHEKLQKEVNEQLFHQIQLLREESKLREEENKLREEEIVRFRLNIREMQKHVSRLEQLILNLQYPPK